ncbi:hypothetical protein ACFOY8_12915 [Thalassospira xianhensis]|uniref:Uncharacterized protein n=1 Tax=Thalassospira xianhensis MCCC 1A02616 TaxID=1177929 RepID=A0A367UHT8_9PROT|nr:hypothetical protein [Thalassospira xianhensis]RCK07877.1 hypothetical protein TH5_02375 [Thalassospira xianhensis MCCC 1A02616]
MKTLELIAFADTAMERDLTEEEAKGVGRSFLTPRLTLPVFKAPKGEAFSKAVAIVYRDDQKNVVHGGLIGMGDEGVFYKLVLIDDTRGINTEADPAWTAFGMNMSLGKLLVQFETGTKEIPWSIAEMSSAPKIRTYESHEPQVIDACERYRECVLPEEFKQDATPGFQP